MTGGEQDIMGYEMGDAYVGKFAGTVVIDGVMYYNRYQATGGSAVNKSRCSQPKNRRRTLG